MTAQTPPKKFKKTVNLRGMKRDVELSRQDLEEALDPTLSTVPLMIPGFNATMTDSRPLGLLPKAVAGKRELKIYHLTPHFEMKLFAIAKPIFDEVESLLEEYTDKGGVKSISLAEGIPEFLQLAVHRLFMALGDYGTTLAKAASIVAEASITLSRVYECKELTPEDYVDIKFLSPEFFLKNVPTEYMLRNIVLPQYKKTGVTELVQLFFSKLKSMILPGLGSLMQQQTGLTTSNIQDSLKNLEDLIPLSTVTLEPNLPSSPMDPDIPGTPAN